MKPAREQIRPRTLAKQRRFIAAFASVGTVLHACVAAKISRRQIYAWLADRDKHASFIAQFEDAKEEAADTLERELLRRGRDGTLEPVFGKLPGRNSGAGQIGVIRRYSDSLLLAAVRKWRPQYREHAAPQVTTNTAFVFRIPSNGRDDVPHGHTIEFSQGGHRILPPAENLASHVAHIPSPAQTFSPGEQNACIEGETVKRENGENRTPTTSRQVAEDAGDSDSSRTDASTAPPIVRTDGE